MFASNINRTDIAIATKQLLSLMNVNIKENHLSKLLSNSKDFPSLESVIEILETMNIKNVAVALKEENLQEIPLPAIAHLTIDGGLFAAIRNVENNNVEWHHYKNGWQNDSISDFSKKWSGITLLVDCNTTYYAKKKFSVKKGVIKKNISIILSSILLLGISCYLGFLNPFLYQKWDILLLFLLNLIGMGICFFALSGEHTNEKVSIIRQERNINMIFMKRIYFYIEEIGIYYFFSGFLLTFIIIYKHILGIFQLFKGI